MRKWQLRIVSLAVLSVLALSSAWAWPSQLYGIKEESPVQEQPLSAESETVPETAAVPEEEPAPSTMLQTQPVETLKSAAESLNVQLEDMLSRRELEKMQESLSAMEVAQQTMVDEYNEIVEERDALAADLAKAMDSKEKSGTRAYMMLDGILGFSEGYPSYGLGLTVGTRLGDSLMVELGADYMLGANRKEVMNYSVDKWTFRAGIGWMF